MTECPWEGWFSVCCTLYLYTDNGRAIPGYLLTLVMVKGKYKHTATTGQPAMERDINSNNIMATHSGEEVDSIAAETNWLPPTFFLTCSRANDAGLVNAGFFLIFCSHVKTLDQRAHSIWNSAKQPCWPWFKCWQGLIWPWRPLWGLTSLKIEPFDIH